MTATETKYSELIKQANKLIAVMDGLKCDLEYADHCLTHGMEPWSLGDAEGKSGYILKQIAELRNEIRKAEGKIK